MLNTRTLSYLIWYIMHLYRCTCWTRVRYHILSDIININIQGNYFNTHFSRNPDKRMFPPSSWSDGIPKDGKIAIETPSCGKDWRWLPWVIIAENERSRILKYCECCPFDARTNTVIKIDITTYTSWHYVSF